LYGDDPYAPVGHSKELRRARLSAASSVEAKLSRMFGSSERILVLPVDHGMALGNVPGLDDPVALALDFLKLDGVNGILSSLPVARRLEEAGMSGDKLRIVTLDSALHGTDGRIWQVPVANPQDVADRGCDAGKVLMAWEDELSSRARTLSLVASLLEDCHRACLPILVEPVASGPTQRLDEGEIERRELEGARIALEAGADIIKMRVWTSDAGRRFVSACPVPVVALGGTLSGGSSDVVQTIKTAFEIGFRGIFVGRNIWQRPRSEGVALMQSISEIVHG
jgi:fructose-bisphosphate aldolase, class I